MSLLGHRPEERPKVATISFADLFKMQFPEQAWYIKTLLPKKGKLLIGGSPKIGKTFLLLELARALTCNRTAFEHDEFTTGKPVNVLLIDQEVGPEFMQERGARIFQDEQEDTYRPRAFLHSKDASLKIDTMSGFNHVRELIKEFQINVLLLDPMARLHSADENSNHEMIQIFSRIDTLIYEFMEQELSVVMAHHFAKKPHGRDAATYDGLSPNNFRGAGDWFAWPDGVMMLDRKWNMGMIGGVKEGWICDGRVIPGRASMPPDFRLHINEHDDGRVRYMGTLEAPSVDEDEPYQEKGRGLRL
jgi:hypothetical protein